MQTITKRENFSIGISEKIKHRVWWFVGWLLIRWWHKFTICMSWKHWWNVVMWRLKETKDAPINHPVRLFISHLMEAGSWHCPHCRYEGWTEDEELFELVNSGTSATGEGTIYWFEGYQTCSRCGKKESYSDSN